MQVRVETTGVEKTAADIRRMAVDVLDGVADAFTRGGQWVTYEARDILRGQITQTYLPHYGRSISSEVNVSPSRISMIVGPESRRLQGGMGPGVEFGSRNAPPTPHLFDAFDNRRHAILERALQNIARWPA